MISHFTSSKSQSQLIDTIQWDLLKAFQKAYDSKKREIIMELLQFVNKLIIEAINQKSVEVLGQLYFMPTFFYRVCKPNEEFRALVVDYQSVSFKSIWFVVKYHIVPLSSEKSRQIVEKFFSSVISFYHELIESKENENIRKALNEFNQMEDYSRSDMYPLRSKFLREKGGKDITPEALLEFKNEVEKQYFILQTQRRAALCLKAWLLYIYSLDKVSFEKVASINQLIELKYDFFEDLLDDMNYIVDRSHQGFLGVNEWDHTERDSGKAHFLPSARDWIMYGVFHQLLTQPPNFDLRMISYRPDLGSHIGEAEKLIAQYKAKIEKWSNFYNIHPTAEDSQVERFRPLLNIFAQLKVFRDSYESNRANKQPLSAEYVDAFKNELSDVWKKQCNVFELFDLFQNIVPLDKVDNLPYLGEQVLLGRAKMMFVKEGNQHIYGMADIGGNIGRETDSAFIEKVFSDEEQRESYNSSVEALDSGIQKLISLGYAPNLIIAPPELSYVGDLSNNQDFVPEWKLANTNTNYSILGTFKNIPVVGLYVSNLKNQIICCQFERAFTLEIFQSAELYFNRLYINVRVLSQEEIDRKFEEDPNHWLFDDKGQKLSKEQAIANVASSVMLEMWCRGRFVITDSNAFVVSLLGEFNP